MSKTIIVFLKFKESSGNNALFLEGDTIWTGYDAIKMWGDVEPVWDEVKVIEFSNEDEYEKCIDQLRTRSNTLESYKLFLVDHHPQKMMDEMNALLKRPLKSPLDTTPCPNLEDVKYIGEPDAMERLQARDKTKPIVVLNFYKFREIALYPDNPKRKISGEFAYSKYAKIPMKFFSLYDMEQMVQGNIISSIVGKNESKWESYVFVRYPSFEMWQMMISAKIYQEVLIHREAALEHPVLYMCLASKE